MSVAGTETRCCDKVWDRNSRWPRAHACKNAAKVERNGQPYCNVHDPVSLAAKQTERDAEAPRPGSGPTP
jgi:hypothetical protein